jgi:hypothetical protein
MSEPRRRDPGDLVSWGPTVDDSRAFTLGLWATQTVLFALVVSGFTVWRGLGDSFTVFVACAALVWFAAVTAIVLRGRLQPSPGPTRRAIALVACVVLAVWFGGYVALAAQGSLTSGTKVALDSLGVVLEFAALVSSYAARMFRWNRE